MEIPPGMKYFVYKIPIGNSFDWGGFIAESPEAAQEIPELKEYPKGTKAQVYEVDKETFDRINSLHKNLTKK